VHKGVLTSPFLYRERCGRTFRGGNALRDKYFRSATAQMNYTPIQRAMIFFMTGGVLLIPIGLGIALVLLWGLLRSILRRG